MKLRAALSLAAGFAVLATLPNLAIAAKLPPILVSKQNNVPACVTPGRLTAFLKDRNKNLPARFQNIAVEYMRHGEPLGIRWDYAFFQMMVETGNLKFTGDVKPYQNNFAGLGATGGGVRGENFKTVGLGARAHMQHALMYAGKYIDDPVADRTRKVQEWKILNKWRKRLPKPITFKHLTRKWSPTDNGYYKDIRAVADRFFGGFCKISDPQPELVAKARGHKTTTKTAATATGKTANKKDINTSGRSSLGGPSLAQGLSKSFSETTKGYQVLNKKDGARTAKQKPSPTKTPEIPSQKPPVKTAAAAQAAAQAKPAKQDKCRVWTASYGGAKAVIIKAVADDGMTNFTVLDVNKGREDREAKAYISAYAKGGATIARFDNQNSALDRAFELCPEE